MHLLHFFLLCFYMIVFSSAAKHGHIQSTQNDPALAELHALKQTYNNNIQKSQDLRSQYIALSTKKKDKNSEDPRKRAKQLKLFQQAREYKAKAREAYTMYGNLATKAHTQGYKVQFLPEFGKGHFVPLSDVPEDRRMPKEHLTKGQQKRFTSQEETSSQEEEQGTSSAAATKTGKSRDRRVKAKTDG